ncbi:MAG: hypothetical protein HXY43_16855 [Fischerella sp.]|uniref:hypothetical protein n=1 Tax=unclassified Fischerella TaxID=494603 RepID=UPI00047BF1D4|nr:MULTISPECIES: hypothetical protein [unclassified Fischerella]NWF60875.1 hypothetical protein [Fischerella sp.]
MLTTSKISGLIVVFAALLGMLTNVAAQSTSIPVNKKAKTQTAIATLADGKYQFCSQPDPKDWRDGAGVCLNFTKVDSRIDGYYGYPHSDSFVCLRGEVNGNLITGEALTISSTENELSEIPKSEWKWDSEGRLKLGQGSIIRSLNDEWGRTDWIVFSNAALNIDGLYQYGRPRMTPPSQLCEWN